jgi:hypothetical protein
MKRKRGGMAGIWYKLEESLVNGILWIERISQ